jgi:hypothetical protein
MSLQSQTQLPYIDHLTRSVTMLARAVSTIWRILSARGFAAPNRTNAPKAATCAWPPSNPMNAGNSTSPIGSSPMTTPGCAWAATPWRCSRPATSIPASAKPLPRMAIRPACSATTGLFLPARYRGTGRVALEVTLHARGICFRHCRPFHPQTCGKVCEDLDATLHRFGLTPAKV